MTADEAGPAWSTITIADSSPSVRFARLGGDRATGAFAALVRFPEGWTRPRSGRYAVEEELLVLEGELEMSGVVYRTGDYACLPPGYVRSRSAAPGGALVVAFFGGPADWARVPGAGAAPHAVPPVRSREVAPRSAPVGPRARPLHEGPAGSTWLVDAALAERAPQDMRLEVVSLPTRSWAAVEPGASVPPLACPCVCRLRRPARRVDPDSV